MAVAKYFAGGDKHGMNVLIIGNGFDLAHNLPTRYSDFLKFLTTFRNETKSSSKKKGAVHSYIEQLTDNDRGIYFACIKNQWYVHFRQIAKEFPQRKSWINFEAEIGEKVKSLTSTQSDEWKSALDKFTDVLNYYFYHYVNNAPVNVRLPDVYENKFDYVLRADVKRLRSENEALRKELLKRGIVEYV